MGAKWIVVVNRVEARIFSRRDMRLLHKLTNTLGREKNRAFTTSRPSLGRNRTASVRSTHNMTGNKNPHNDAAKAFARRVSRFLEGKASSQDEILVSAEPRMMGWIKREMDTRLLDQCDWLPKDLGKLKVHELKEFLRSHQ